MARVGASLFTLLCWLAMTGNALACSCVRPDRQLTGAEYDSWSFERAAHVVRGRIVDIRAGTDTTRGGRRIVVAKMRIASVVKGDVPTGDATILTMFGTGDCGIPAFLLTAIAWDREIILEVRKVPELPGEYVVDMCGYGRIPPMSGMESAKP